MSLAAVKGFGGFAQAAGQAFVDEGEFEDSYSSMVLVVWFLRMCAVRMVDCRQVGEKRTFQGVEDGHGTT